MAQEGYKIFPYRGSSNALYGVTKWEGSYVSRFIPLRVGDLAYMVGNNDIGEQYYGFYYRDENGLCKAVTGTDVTGSGDCTCFNRLSYDFDYTLTQIVYSNTDCTGEQVASLSRRVQGSGSSVPITIPYPSFTVTNLGDTGFYSGGAIPLGTAAFSELTCAVRSEVNQLYLKVTHYLNIDNLAGLSWQFISHIYVDCPVASPYSVAIEKAFSVGCRTGTGRYTTVTGTFSPVVLSRA